MVLEYGGIGIQKENVIGQKKPWAGGQFVVWSSGLSHCNIVIHNHEKAIKIQDPWSFCLMYKVGWNFQDSKVFVQIPR